MLRNTNILEFSILQSKEIELPNITAVAKSDIETVNYVNVLETVNCVLETPQNINIISVNRVPLEGH